MPFVFTEYWHIFYSDFTRKYGFSFLSKYKHNTYINSKRESFWVSKLTTISLIPKNPDKQHSHNTQCGNCRNLHSHSRIFVKNFVKLTFLQNIKKLVKIDFTKYFFSEREFLVFPHCALWKFRNFTTTPRFFCKNSVKLTFY